MRPPEIRRRLADHGVRARKGLGQHFLLYGRVADRAVDHVEPSAEATVLEVGPGLGVLTVRLARAFGRVVAVEKDRRIARALKERLAEEALGNVDVVVGDALDVELPEAEAVCANLPYQISSPITFRLLDHDFDRAVLMYQKEFAERLCADPGTKEYGRLTVMAHARARCELLETVPAGAFWPKPKVDSALVRLTWRDPDYAIEDMGVFAEVVRALFSHRRKKSSNAVLLHVGKLGGEARVEAALEEWGLGDKRPGTLAPGEIAELANRIAG